MQLQVTDEYGEAMPGTIITFGKNSMEGRTTDINGKATISRPRMDGRFELYIRGYAGTPFVVPLAGNHDYKMRVMLKAGFFARMVAAGTTMRYAIRNTGQHSIELKPEYKAARWAVYKKTVVRE